MSWDSDTFVTFITPQTKFSVIHAIDSSGNSGALRTFYHSDKNLGPSPREIEVDIIVKLNANNPCNEC